MNLCFSRLFFFVNSKFKDLIVLEFLTIIDLSTINNQTFNEIKLSNCLEVVLMEENKKVALETLKVTDSDTRFKLRGRMYDEATFMTLLTDHIEPNFMY